MISFPLQSPMRSSSNRLVCMFLSHLPLSVKAGPHFRPPTSSRRPAFLPFVLSPLPCLCRSLVLPRYDRDLALCLWSSCALPCTEQTTPVGVTVVDQSRQCRPMFLSAIRGRFSSTFVTFLLSVRSRHQVPVRKLVRSWQDLTLLFEYPRPPWPVARGRRQYCTQL